MNDPRPRITCPVCGRTSWHPMDIEQLYCGLPGCNWWTSDPALARANPAFAETPPDPAQYELTGSQDHGLIVRRQNSTPSAGGTARSTV